MERFLIIPFMCVFKQMRIRKMCVNHWSLLRLPTAGGDYFDEHELLLAVMLTPLRRLMLFLARSSLQLIMHRQCIATAQILRSASPMKRNFANSKESSNTSQVRKLLSTTVEESAGTGRRRQAFLDHHRSQCVSLMTPWFKKL